VKFYFLRSGGYRVGTALEGGLESAHDAPAIFIGQVRSAR
jgi:hypothetical protein